MPKTLQPELNEFAAPPGQPWGEVAILHDSRRLGEHIVRSEGFAGHASAYSLFEEMEDKDAHLFSLIQTRKLGVLARPRKVEPAGERPGDVRTAQWIAAALEGIPGWDAAILHLLDALAKGMAVLEILWGFDGEGRIVPRRLKPRAAGRFGWSERAGEWRLLEGERNLLGPGRPLPPRKFLITLCGASDERPYGKGLCERVFWYWWFKKHNLKFWLIYNEKFGSPTVVARHAAGLGESERERLLEVIDALQSDAGVTIPEGITLELLEANRSGSAETYEKLARWCNEEMSRAVLGQTLTSSEGARSGSLALAQVHEAVRQDYLRADAWLLADVINTQLVRALVDLNFGEDVPAPRWLIDTSPELDLAREVEVDRQLLRMGVPLSISYFYEKYGRPAPTGEARRLQYDDSNLYQYHLQFGVLTVNEVRAKLGLPAVTWGDKPTSPVDTRSTPKTPGESTGEATSEEESDEEAREQRLER